MKIPPATACFDWNLPLCKKSNLLFWITLGTSDHIHLKWLNSRYSSCFMCVKVAHTRLLFFTIFSNFVHFCPNFKTFLPFFWKIERMPLCFASQITQKQLWHSFLIIYIYIYNIYIYIYIAKIPSTSYFGYFGHFRPLPSKNIIPTCRNFDAYLHAKMNSIPNF